MFGGLYFGGAVIGGFMSFLGFTPFPAQTIPSGPATQWGNNDTKPLQQWTATGKQLSRWANNDVKVPSIFTAVSKNTTGWGPENPIQTYFYDDPFMTYNSPYVDYNMLADTNQSNQLLVTRWTGV